jgi:hypothetical protein
MPTATRLNVVLTPLLTTILAIGCSFSDERLAEYSERANDLQARQNEVTARQAESISQQSKQIAETAHELVEQDAAARRELVQAHEQARAELHRERVSLDDQRQTLEVERRGLAAARQRDPIIAESIGAAAVMLAALLPLLLAAYALRQLGSGSTEEAVQEVLIRELVEGSMLSAPPTPGLHDRSSGEPPCLEQGSPGEP